MKSAKVTASQCRQASRAACFAIAIAAGLAGCSDDPPLDPLVIEEANIATVALRVGGATQDVTRYNDGTTDWTIYTMAERLAATKIGTVKDAVAEIALPGYIKRVTLVLPRVPFTWMRIGIRARRRRCKISSSAPSSMRTPHAVRRMTISSDTRLAPIGSKAPEREPLYQLAPSQQACRGLKSDERSIEASPAVPLKL